MVLVPCCGGSTSQEIDLSAAGGDVEVDLSNPNAVESRVDGFITSLECAKLFDGSYSGTTQGALCQILVGPAKPRTVSERKKLPAGRYKWWAQAYAINEASASVEMELGIYTNRCRWNPISP